MWRCGSLGLGTTPTLTGAASNTPKSKLVQARAQIGRRGSRFVEPFGIMRLVPPTRQHANQQNARHWDKRFSQHNLQDALS